jgi:nucleoside 2-deoxyribosyltransferase
MPFDPAFDDVFFVGVKHAARSIGATAIRVDQTMHGRDAVVETQQLIRRCSVVVADVSTSEPDVLYELGFAQALGKPSVQICSTAYEDLPFMVRNRETLLYRPGRTHLLGEQLAVYLSRMLRIA